MSDTDSKDPRKVSDVLISLEEKVELLIKTISANDMNNKLILDRLNKLLAKGGESSTTFDAKSIPFIRNDSISATVPPPPPSPPTPKKEEPPPKVSTIELPVSFADTEDLGRVEKQSPKVKSKTKKEVSDNKEQGVKIPVGQRVTDNNGKDLFMADVEVSNIDTGDSVKIKTNVVGKWQVYLAPGTYNVHISKIVDATTLQKIECLQEIEVTKQMKSLQLPIVIIKR